VSESTPVQVRMPDLSTLEMSSERTDDGYKLKATVQTVPATIDFRDGQLRVTIYRGMK
jgi:hypothetical protein